MFLVNQPLDDQLELWPSPDDSILGILVAQVVQVCLIETNNCVASL